MSTPPPPPPHTHTHTSLYVLHSAVGINIGFDLSKPMNNQISARYQLLNPLSVQPCLWLILSSAGIYDQVTHYLSLHITCNRKSLRITHKITVITLHIITLCEQP